MVYLPKVFVRKSIPSGRKMIPRNNLSKFHKLFSVRKEGGRFLTAFFSKKATFSPVFAWKFLSCSGDVTCRRGGWDGFMHRCMRFFPQGRRLGGKREIPVENSYFSTFSTGFSTGVFHSVKGNRDA